MRTATWLAGLVLLNSACTTLRPTEASPEELQRLIVNESLIEPDERVRLVTADESVYEFRVTRIDFAEGVVMGKEEAVPIADIVAVETRERAVGKTIALTGGLVYGIGVLIAIAVAPAVLLGSL